VAGAIFNFDWLAQSAEQVLAVRTRIGRGDLDPMIFFERKKPPKLSVETEWERFMRTGHVEGR
jgi:hypothetical protein